MSIFLSYQLIDKVLVQTVELSKISATTKPLPYKSGYPVDMITNGANLFSPHVCIKLEDIYKSLVN